MLILKQQEESLIPETLEKCYSFETLLSHIYKQMHNQTIASLKITGISEELHTQTQKKTFGHKTSGLAGI